MTVLDDQSATRPWRKIGWDEDHPPSFLPHPRALHRQRVPEAQILASTIMAFLYSLVKVIYPLLVILAAVLLYSYGPEHSLTTLVSPVTHHTPTSPYAASWRSWFHPLQSQLGYAPTSLKKDWNVLHHLGGNGPWVEMLDEGSRTPDLAPSPGCSIDQVHMMSRHAERYPTPLVGYRHLKFLERARLLELPFNGSLEFLNEWTYFTDNPERDFGQLTSTGPYAGTLGAFTTGVRFRTRYGEILPKDNTIRFWASDSERVIESARYFASGLFGLNWESRDKAVLEIIPETFERGADTLTPGDTCQRYLEDTTDGHDNGDTMLRHYQDVYTPAIAARLTSENPALGSLLNTEVYAMQEMCGFETMVRGSSPWCDVFTEEDWLHFEYARDIKHYYGSGPGNPYAGAMGWLWLNATATLLKAGPEAGPMFLSFVHDGDISPLLAALDLFKDPRNTPLPLTYPPADRSWKTSTILPMGARITFERMTCPTEDDRDDEVYVRINVNDRIVQLPGCVADPGHTCSLDSFLQYVNFRREEVGDFGEVCGLEGHAGKITFLHQDRD
ncbi:hypothetical protein PMG11_08301 [Penicillium brasilianum]|uniref:Phosphoglycerate mutase-like protein n=1 Tax=Penicillium brasilianum TaxID=104259 RepID=A0A0F7TSK9_PENBI|nr:hypothetical protein PMG11_08301 [Penicillium brasilianum]